MVKLYVFSYYRCTSLKYIFTFYDPGINLQILSYFRMFIDPTRNVNYKGIKNSEKIQRVKIRLALGSYEIKPCKWNQKVMKQLRLENTSELRYKYHVIYVRKLR